MIAANPVTEGIVILHNDTMHPTLPAGSLVLVNYADQGEYDGLALVNHAGQRKIARISFDGDRVAVWGDCPSYPVHHCQRAELDVVGHVLRQYKLI